MLLDYTVGNALAIALLVFEDIKAALYIVKLATSVSYILTCCLKRIAVGTKVLRS